MVLIVIRVENAPVKPGQLDTFFANTAQRKMRVTVALVRWQSFAYDISAIGILRIGASKIDA